MTTAQPGNRRAFAPGEALERLVSLIEAALLCEKRCVVERRKRLRDKDTGRLREHDVVLTWTERHHVLVTALECRDRGRPVGVPDVEAFHVKCQRTGVHRGAIVSSRGFSRTARLKAAQLGVGCLEMEAAASFDWCVAPGILSRVKYIHHISVRTLPADPAELEEVKDKEFILFAINDIEFSTELVNINADENINWDLIEPNKIHQVRLEFPDNAFYSILNDGRRIEICKLYMDVVFEMEEFLQPLKFSSYSTEAGSYSVASTIFQSKDDMIQLAMVRGEDGITHVSARVEGPSRNFVGQVPSGAE